MTDGVEWTIEFYVTAEGRSPVRDFIDNLDDKTQARLLASIEQLRVRNVHAREPLVKHLEGKLWELRRISDGSTYRLLYLFFTERRIVFIHGFAKKSQKTPRRELETAKARMDDYVARKGGEW